MMVAIINRCVKVVVHRRAREAMRDLLVLIKAKYAATPLPSSWFIPYITHCHLLQPAYSKVSKFKSLDHVPSETRESD